MRKKVTSKVPFCLYTRDFKKFYVFTFTAKVLLIGGNGSNMDKKKKKGVVLDLNTGKECDAFDSITPYEDETNNEGLSGKN